jgi:Ribonuclease G/E
MKGRQIVLDEIAGRPAAALLIDGALDDLLVAPPEDVPVPGAIYRAMVDRPMKGQGGAVLRLPEGGRAYLRQAKGLTPGTALLVQVAGFAEGGKATPVTTRLLFKSRYAIATPEAPGLNVSRKIRDEERRVELLSLVHEVAEAEGPHGIILRSAAEAGEDDAVAEDIAAMAGLCAAVMADVEGAPELLVEGPDPHLLAWRDWGDVAVDEGPGAFARHGVDAMIERLRGPRRDLPGGAHLFVEPTRALVAVDVNTGADTSLAAGLKANIAMARALPAELRCRGLGGQIVLDVAPMPKKDRRQFEQVLKSAFRADPVETALAGWTPLGHFELQRRRDRLPLTECLP